MRGSQPCTTAGLATYSNLPNRLLTSKLSRFLNNRSQASNYTSLLFIVFGFGIAAIGQTLERTVLAQILGVGFVAVALLAVAVAMVQYRQELKMIEASDYRYKPSLPLGIISGVVLFLIGLFAVVGIIIGPLVG